MQAPETRHSLIVRLHCPEDAAAWTEFCSIYECAIYRVSRDMGLQDADAREATQEVLLRVSQKVRHFDTLQTGSFRGWLSKLAKHAAVDVLRRKKATSIGGTSFQRALNSIPAVLPDLGQILDREIHQQRFLWAAHKVRAASTPNSWNAFWRTAVDGLDGASVAKELGMSVGAVYLARCRTLAKLRKLLAPYEGELS
ncbi:MAG: sigma-70 family RNA polymerase sigma factor [Planctomycetales bacterium]|nr:sigma-70 family RNA polymerase sigma factor [Planctomycetales bacterium]